METYIVFAVREEEQQSGLLDGVVDGTGYFYNDLSSAKRKGKKLSAQGYIPIITKVV